MHAGQDAEPVSFPLRNGSLYAFGHEVNCKWMHGVNALPYGSQKNMGRISIIVWGLHRGTSLNTSPLQHTPSHQTRHLITPGPIHSMPSQSQMPETANSNASQVIATSPGFCVRCQTAITPGQPIAKPYSATRWYHSICCHIANSQARQVIATSHSFCRVCRSGISPGQLTAKPHFETRWYHSACCLT